MSKPEPSRNDAAQAVYRRQAARFDRERGRQLVEKAWLDAFLEMLPSGAEVLDLGCGAGEPIAGYLISCGCQVTGVDFSPEMLKIARRRFPAQTWVNADMRQMNLGRQFDGIVAWDSFFHLEMTEQRAMFPIFSAHLRPGGALMFTSGPTQGEVTGHAGGEEVFHASLSPQDYRELLVASGFEVVEFMPEDPDCGLHTIWLARR